MCYHRITLPLRYKVEALHKGRHTVSQIAAQLGIHRTTIGRELERCTPYTAPTAQQDAEQQRARRHRPRLPGAVWANVTDRLQHCHSPEQIHGRCVLEGQDCPSVERIYQYVYAHPDLTPLICAEVALAAVPTLQDTRRRPYGTVFRIAQKRPTPAKKSAILRPI